MAITHKTRKILWGKSGNQCAFCGRTLIEDATETDDESIVADEAHIVSKKPKGPRGDQKIDYDYDSYHNLILLCRVHHKLVDDQEATFTVEALQLLKKNHEEKVRKALSPTDASFRQQMGLRVTNGHELLKFADNVGGFKYHYDPPKTEKEHDAVSVFVGHVGDCFDILGDITMSSRLEMEFETTKMIQKLEELGFWVFAGTEHGKWKSSVGEFPMTCLVVMVVRSDNPEIINVSELLYDQKDVK